MALFDDIKSIVLSELAKLGFEYSNADETDLLLRRYLNLKSKMIDKMPRNIIESKELLSQNISLPYKDALQKIKDKIVAGVDINCHLSKDALNPDEADFLLYDWSIHHIHLSDTKSNANDYFYQRSDYLLFALISTSEAFLIDVLPHREKNVFAKRHLLSIIQGNWPHFLEPYEMKDILALEHNPSDEEIDKYRRAGLNVCIELNGKFYVPMGGGLTTAKTSVAHRIEIDNLIHWLKNVEKYLADNAQAILNKINIQNKLQLTELKPTVIMIENRFVVIEKHSETILA